MELGIKWVNQPNFKRLVMESNRSIEMTAYTGESGRERLRFNLSRIYTPKFRVVDKELFSKYFGLTKEEAYPGELLKTECFELNLLFPQITLDYTDEFLEKLMQIKQEQDPNLLARKYVEGYGLKRVFDSQKASEELIKKIENERTHLLMAINHKPKIKQLTDYKMMEYQNTLINQYNL